MSKKFRRPFSLSRRQWVPALSLFLLLASGCAKEHAATYKMAGEARLSAPISSRIESASKIRTLKAFTDLRFSRGKSLKHFNMSVLAVFPSKVRFDIEDPLGGTIHLDSNNFDKTFSRFTGLRWEEEKFIKILSGGIPCDADPKVGYATDEEGRYWIFPAVSAVRWNETSGILEYEEFKNGKSLFKIEFGNYAKKGRLFFPLSIKISSTKKKAELSLGFTFYELNKPIEEGAFEGI